MDEQTFLSETGQSPGAPLDYQDLYKRAVTKFPTGSTFVEIGVYKGRSAQFLVKEMLRQGKRFNINLVEIDTLHHVIKHNDWLRKHCIFHPCPSLVAASRFANQSVDFCWIDADHSYKAVCDDILAWHPKIKPGGVLAGHDWYDNPQKNNFVKSAVADTLPCAVGHNKSWYLGDL